MSKNTAAWEGCSVLHHPFPTPGQDPFCSPKPPTSLGIRKVTAEPAKLFQTCAKLCCSHTCVCTEQCADTRQVWLDWTRFTTRQEGTG